MGDSKRSIFERPIPLVNQPRRKSFLHRITDSLSSFLPASFFESNTDIDDSNPTPSKNRRIDLLNINTDCISQNEQKSPHNESTVSQFNHKPPFFNTEVDLDADDNGSDSSANSKTSISTSGVSSLLPHSVRVGSYPKPFDRPTIYRHLSAPIKHEIINKRNESVASPLWSDYHKAKRKPSSINQPPRKRIKTENSQDTMLDMYSSPFYKGKTSYGGASSQQFRNMFEHVAPLRLIVETQEQPKSHALKHNSSTMLSETAQRILESLERHTSVITSNDKIPLPQIIAPPVKSLNQVTRYPPYMASFRRFKLNQQNSRAVSVPNSMSFANFESKPVVQEEQQNCNIKCLPQHAKEISVTHMTLLPRNMASTSLSNNLTSKAIYPDSLDPNPNSIQTNSTPLMFKFSNPILCKPQQSLISTHLIEQPKYEFCPPNSSLKPASSTASFLPILLSNPKPHIPKTVTTHFEKNDIPSTVWRCESCLSENISFDEVCTVCRLPQSLPNRNERSLSKDESQTVYQSEKDWECPVCMVDNKFTDNKCVCCQSEKPHIANSDSKSLSPIHKVSKPFSFTFGPPKNQTSTDSSWECTSCMVDNKHEASNCVCCQFPKPTTASLKSGEDNPPTNTKQIDGFWECDTCLVNNQSSLTTCPCCQSKRNSTPENPPDLESKTICFGSPSMSIKTSDVSSPPIIVSSMKVNQNKMPFNFSTPVTTSLNIKSSLFSFGTTSVSNVKSTSPPLFSFPLPMSTAKETVTDSLTRVSTNSSDFVLGFKQATFSSVAPSTSLAFTLPIQKTNSIVDSINHIQKETNRPTPFKFGVAPSIPTTISVNGYGGISENVAIPPFNFIGTQMKENVTPFSFSNSSTLFNSTANVQNSTALPNTPFKFGESNTATANSLPFVFNSVKPSNSMFSVTGAPNQPSINPIHGRPIRRAVRRHPRN